MKQDSEDCNFFVNYRYSLSREFFCNGRVLIGWNKKSKIAEHFAKVAIKSVMCVLSCLDLRIHIRHLNLRIRSYERFHSFDHCSAPVRPIRVSLGDVVDGLGTTILYSFRGLNYKILRRNHPKMYLTIISKICVRVIHKMNVHTENASTHLFQMWNLWIANEWFQICLVNTPNYCH